MSDDDPAVTVDCGDSGSSIAVLMPGEDFVCSASGVASVGLYSNVGSVTGTPGQPDPNDPSTIIPIPDAEPATADDVSHYIGASPSMDVEKATNGEDADAAPGTAYLEGDAITWTYVVTNTGDIELIDVEVGDDQGVAVDCGNGTSTIGFMAPGDSVTCTGSGTAIDDAYVNTASVIGTPAYEDPNNPGTFVEVPGAPKPADTDQSHYDGAPIVFDLALVKKVTSSIPTNAAAPLNLTFEIEVFNQGTVDAANIEIVDYMPTNMTLDDPTWTDNGDGTASHIVEGPLAPGDSVVVSIDTKLYEYGNHENLAGIEAAEAFHPGTGAALNLVDVDSTFGDPTQDPVVDDEIDNAGGDADQSDKAEISFEGPSTLFSETTTTPSGLGNTGSSGSGGSGSSNPAPNRLAFTGTNTQTLTTLAVILMTTGAALIVASKVRRKDDDLFDGNDLEWKELDS